MRRIAAMCKRRVRKFIRARKHGEAETKRKRNAYREQGSREEHDRPRRTCRRKSQLAGERPEKRDGCAEYFYYILCRASERL